MSLQELDSPLPPELIGREHGWFTRYRRWPVFSRPWVRGRAVSMGAAALVFLALVLVPMPLQPLDGFPFGGLAQLTVQVLLPLFLGPWLGWQVRRRGLPPRQEGLGLAAALLVVVLVMLAFHEFAAEPMKQQVAEWTGQVDEQGQRKRAVMTIGVMVRQQGPEPQPALSSAESPQVRLANAGAGTLLTLWLAGGLALWGWHRERQGLATLARERELAQAQAQRREAELRLSVLAAQVEPHFLFNTLAGVRSAIHSDPARASQMIDQLVDYLRASIPRLRGDGTVQANVGGQLEIVRAYLGLMAARMPRLSYSVQAAPELLPAPCPPLMLISLAENAVKHGVEPKMGPVRVDVLAERAPDGALLLRVLDDGVGFGHESSGATAGSGLGLTNIRERLAQLYGDRAALELRARPGGGVAATLHLPAHAP